MSKIYFCDGMDEISKLDLSKVKIKKHPKIKFMTNHAGKTPFFEALSAGAVQTRPKPKPPSKKGSK